MFLFGSDLTKKIFAILAEPNARCAIAFWGQGSEDWVTGPGCRIIANLRMGGTNPYAFRSISGQKRHHERLHAKVYIGSSSAVITSANASSNGLGLEGVEQSGWIEAGFLTRDIEAVERWFETLWLEARDVEDADWTAAEVAWRSRSKPTLPSFADYNVDRHDLPFVFWVGTDASWSVNKEAVKDAAGVVGDVAERRVDDGIWIRHAKDAKLLMGKWVLVWEQTASGRISTRRPPWFARMSHAFVPGGFSWDGSDQPQDVLLAEEAPSQPPFDTSEPRFRAALSEALRQPGFEELWLPDEDSVSWFAPKSHVLPAFWQAVRQCYLRQEALVASEG